MATTADALVTSALFFNGKDVAIRHTFKQTGELTELDGTPKPVFVFWKQRPSRSEGEIRGEFFDLGRMEAGDVRITSYDFNAVIAAANNGKWPPRDRLFVILGAALIPSDLPAAPTLRAIALAPEKYENRGVTLVGRFRGRNLYGDLAQPLGKSKWDFVLQSADAALWISGIRPKGKEFDLDPGARVDTGRWVQVSGTVRRDGPIVWIAGGAIELATAPTDTPVEVDAPPPPPPPAPTVIFSAPIQDDTDVPTTTTVKLQFSWDMEGRSFRDGVRVRYTGRTPPGAAAPSPPAFTMRYDEGTRSLEIRFAEPLQRFQTITVDLLDGITAFGGARLAPWSLSFSTGG